MIASTNKKRWVGMSLAAIALSTTISACLDNSSDEDDACRKLEAALASEKQHLQACQSDTDCGASEGKGTCGCTRALPIRADADPTKYRALIDRAIACDLPVGGGSCDCPPAKGFRCDNNVCAWNYLPL
jgi:hypothetical protein